MPPIRCYSIIKVILSDSNFYIYNNINLTFPSFLFCLDKDKNVFSYKFCPHCSGFEDYGDYWRYNYETFEEDAKYKYTRDELMNDVRSLYHEVQHSLPCVSHVFHNDADWAQECEELLKWMGWMMVIITAWFLTDNAFVQGAACLC